MGGDLLHSSISKEASLLMLSIVLHTMLPASTCERPLKIAASPHSRRCRTAYPHWFGPRDHADTYSICPTT